MGTYLTPDELVAYLKLPSKQTVYQWRTRGYGPPGVKVGKHVRFRLEDVDKWMEEQKGAA
ncbi:helix-turn-helix transcriptional regulator [Longimycelium tulufanense]|nr:helix-turn-helix domain-containing protein [Longimycelium tulufanense]